MKQFYGIDPSPHRQRDKRIFCSFRYLDVALVIMIIIIIDNDRSQIRAKSSR